MNYQNEDEFTKIWKQYERGIDYLTRHSTFAKADECYRFYNGDQWYGLITGGEKPSCYNIIRPIVDYKLSMVAQNGMSIHYSSMNYDEKYHQMTSICDKLNRHAEKTWERLKLERIIWDIISDACISGDSFAYFYHDNDEIAMNTIDGTNVFLSDEQETEIQNQKYILIAQRLFVENIKEQARANGISEDEISLIVSDTETSRQTGERAKTEVEADEDGGKCISVLKMWKVDGTVHIARSVKNVVYQPDTAIEGMKLYPIAHFAWNLEKGSARGIGEVYARIPNQIEINKSLARLVAGIKQYAFPHIVYDSAVLNKENVDRLSVVGSNIGVNANKLQRVSDTIQYLQPASINPMASDIVNRMISTTRELAGAGDAVTGQINPEQASGAAIIAVRDAAALPLNGQVAAFRQFVEDIARIWYDMWTAYHPNGMEIVTESEKEGEAPEKEMISAEDLQKLKIDVKVDVSPSNPFSKFAQEQALQNLFGRGAITFEEYVKALDDDASAPKAKLQEIADARKAEAQEKAQQMLPEILKQMKAGQGAQGGAGQAMPQLPPSAGGSSSPSAPTDGEMGQMGQGSANLQ